MKAVWTTSLLMALCIPMMSHADDVVDVEMLIAAPNGRYYVILQQDGEAEIVRRSASRPPIRSRLGEKRPEMSVLRLGATAEELSRASGLLHGIQPEPGDAIIGTTRLRDRLDEMHVFGDGTGFVARYSSSPSRFDDLEPIRGPDGADEGLVAVEQRPVGEDRVVASFVHLYARKDALFWGDPSRKLVMMVAGGSALSVGSERGAFLADRASGARPRMIAWSFESKSTVPAPIDALLDRIRTEDPSAGLVAFLLARELDFERTAASLNDVVNDPSVPHPTRLHAATTLHAEGVGSGDRLIMETARGRMGPHPDEAPLVLTGTTEVDGPDQVAAEARIRAYAVGVLPITHPDRAPGVLISLVDDVVVGSAARRALALGPWPTPLWTQRVLIDVARDLSRKPSERAVASELLAQKAATDEEAEPEETPLWQLYAWLAADEDPRIHGPVLEALPDLSDQGVVPALLDALTAPESTGSQRQEAAWSLATRSWRSNEAIEALLRVAQTSGEFSGAREALGVLWRLKGERVLDILSARCTSGGDEGMAALHSLLLTARVGDDRSSSLERLERLPPNTAAYVLSLPRMLALLEPARIRWE